MDSRIFQIVKCYPRRDLRAQMSAGYQIEWKCLYNEEDYFRFTEADERNFTTTHGYEIPDKLSRCTYASLLDVWAQDKPYPFGMEIWIFHDWRFC